MRDLTIEAVIMKLFVDVVKQGASGARELLIQNEKLHRMLKKEIPDKYQLAAESFGAGPTKQERKQRGKAHAKIGKQHSKVRSLLVKFVGERLRANTGKQVTRKHVHAATKSIYALLALHTQDLISKSSKMVGKPVPSPTPRPFSRIGSR
jgi:hypothetical protein